jgi:PTS system nitrogen regulatory IIA component
MKLVSLINSNLIRIGREEWNYQTVVNRLIDDLYSHYRFDVDIAKIRDAIWTRESLGGTIFETGIAIPHARLENFNDILIGIYLPKTPIPTTPHSIRIITLILTSQTESTLYLNTLAAFIKLSQRTDIFGQICNSRSPHEFMAHLTEADLNIKKELSVADIMSTDLVMLSENLTLREVADLFYKNNISYAPVVNQNRELCGEMNVLDLIQLGIPNYAMMFSNLSFLKRFEPFEELLQKEDKILVKDVMRKPTLFIEPTTSIIEATFELTRNKRRHLPVLENNRLVGVLSFMDILTKVLRG